MCAGGANFSSSVTGILYCGALIKFRFICQLTIHEVLHTMSVLTSLLFTGILLTFVILALGALRGTVRIIRKWKTWSEDESWLLDESERTGTYGRRSLVRLASNSLNTLTRRRKNVVLALIVILIIMSGMYILLSGIPYITNSIYNADALVFTEVIADSDNGILSIKGVHHAILDPRICKVKYLIPYTPMESGPLNVSSCWNLTCKLSADDLGYAELIVEYVLHTSRFNAIDKVEVWRVVAINGVFENSTTQNASISFQYFSSAKTRYHVGIVLTVSLSGHSSIEGIEPGTPATLLVYNVSISKPES